MAFSYDMQTSKKDNVSSSCLFICHMLSYVCNIFVSTFLVAYIYEFALDTFDYVFRVGSYYLSWYIAFMIFNFLFAWITDNTNRVWVYRLAQVFKLGFIISIIFAGRFFASHLVLSGAVYGFIEACYYGSYNVLKQEMVSRKSMSKFSALITLGSKAVNVIVPVTLGALIHVSTYEQTSIYVAVILGLVVLLSFWIKAKKPDGSRYDLKGYINRLKSDNPYNKKIKFMYKASLVYGFTTINNSLLNICVMLQFGSTLSLGSITSIIGIISMVELFVFTKISTPGKRNWSFILSMVLPLIASLCFVIYPHFVTVIIFNLLMSIGFIVPTAVFDIYRNSNLKEAGMYQDISEHQTITETMFNISRIISFAVMMLVGLLKSLVVFKILLVVFSLAYSAVALFLLVYEKKFVAPTIADKKDNQNLN